MIRIAIVDDHPALRAGIGSVLESQVDLVPVGFAASEQELWPMLNTTRPDLVLLDYHLPGSDGLQLCRRIKANPPAPKVLLYTAYAGSGLAIPAALAGADGIVGKGTAAQELFETLRTVASGERMLPPVPPQLQAEAARRLDPEDKPILAMLLSGSSFAEVATVMELDEPAVARRVSAMIGALRLEVSEI